MPLQPYPGFIGGEYLLSTQDASGDLSINLYPEAIQSGNGKNAWSLVSRPGWSAFASLSFSPVRCLWAGDNRLFAVAGDSPAHFLEISSTGTETDRGAVGSGYSDPAQICSNGTQLLIRNGLQVWCDNGVIAPARPSWGTLVGTVTTAGAVVTWVTGDLFPRSIPGTIVFINAVPYTVLSWQSPTQITLTTSAGVQVGVSFSAPDYVSAVCITVLDGYFIALKPDTNSIYISGYKDGTVWNPLDFAERTGESDRMAAVFVAGGNLWMMGQKTIEIWTNTGNADFPFQRIDGATMNEGIYAKNSVCLVGESVMWLGGNAEGSMTVWMADGYSPVRVSNNSTEYQLGLLNASAGAADGLAYSYVEDGHQFYCLNFPNSQIWTYVYDRTVPNIGMAWHRRQEGTTSPAAQSVWYHAYTFSPAVHLMGVGSNNKIVVMSSAVFQDVSQAYRKTRQAPHLNSNALWNFYHKLQIDMQMGDAVGGTINLQISNDGGNTFGTAKPITFGAALNYTFRAIWWRLGRARDRVFKVYTDASRRIVIVNAYIDVDGGVS